MLLVLCGTFSQIIELYYSATFCVKFPIFTIYTPRAPTFSSLVPGFNVATDTLWPKIVNTLTWTFFVVRMVITPLEPNISTPSVTRESTRLRPCTSCVVSRHCICCATAGMLSDKASTSATFTRNCLIALYTQCINYPTNDSFPLAKLQIIINN